MKYAAAILLGLASVKASNHLAMFDGTPYMVINEANLMLSQTLDADIGYGTMFTPGTGADANGDYVSQAYGVYAEAWFSALYSLTIPDVYNFQIEYVFYPAYYVPAELQVNIYRYLGTYMATDAAVGYSVNTYYDLLNLETSWTDNLPVTGVSIWNYVVDGTGELFPDSTSWGLSTNELAEDSIWGGSAIYGINRLLGSEVLPYELAHYENQYVADYFPLM